jgi:hypothetical protein
VSGLRVSRCQWYSSWEEAQKVRRGPLNVCNTGTKKLPAAKRWTGGADHVANLRAVRCSAYRMYAAGLIPPCLAACLVPRAGPAHSLASNFECMPHLCLIDCCRWASSWTPPCSARQRSSSYRWSAACAYYHTTRCDYCGWPACVLRKGQASQGLQSLGWA